jgi:hypothetical protein
MTLGVTVRHWEFGAFARWEFEREVREDAKGDASLAALGGGALVGQRQALGPTWLVYGGTLGLYSIDTEHQQRAGGRRPESNESLLSPRLGGYLGCVLPRKAPVHLRVELAAEVAFLDADPTKTELPDEPRWGLGLTVGIETGFSP